PHGRSARGTRGIVIRRARTEETRASQEIGGEEARRQDAGGEEARREEAGAQEEACRSQEKGKVTHGSKSPSLRLPPRLRQALEIPVVRNQGLLQAAARGRPVARHPQEPSPRR